MGSSVIFGIMSLENNHGIGIDPMSYDRSELAERWAFFREEMASCIVTAVSLPFTFSF
jgi:hypothetical protein